MKLLNFFLIFMLAAVSLIAANKEKKIELFGKIAEYNAKRYKEIAKESSKIEIKKIYFPTDLNVNDINKYNKNKLLIKQIFGVSALKGIFNPSNDNELVLIYKITNYILLNDEKLVNGKVLIVSEYDIKKSEHRVVDVIQSPEDIGYINWLTNEKKYQIKHVVYDKDYKIQNEFYVDYAYGGLKENKFKIDDFDYSTSISENFGNTSIESEASNNQNPQINVYKIKKINGKVEKNKILDNGTAHKMAGEENIILYNIYSENHSIPSFKQINKIFYNFNTKEYFVLNVNDSIIIPDKKDINYRNFLSISKNRTKILFIFSVREDRFGIFDLEKPIF